MSAPTHDSHLTASGAPGRDYPPFELDDDASSGALSLRYDGKFRDIQGLPTRADLVQKADTAGLGQTLESSFADGLDVYFFPNDVIEQNQYVRGIPVYKIHLIGVLQNGAKAHVILDGIKVYFDVCVPGSSAVPDFVSHLRQIFVDKNINPTAVEGHEAFPIRGYRRKKVAWERLYFSNLQSRKEAITAVRHLGYETANDDLTSYFRMAAREPVDGFVLTDWGILSKYEYYRGGANASPQKRDASRNVPDSPLCEHIFRVDVHNFKPLVDPMASEVQDKRRADLSRDKSLVMTWDIETRSTAQTGDVPKALNATDHVFMIGATLHWKDDATPLHRVCIVDVDSEPDERWTTVVCGTEENVIKAFAVVFRHFAPDFLVDFNGGNYDWPFVIEKAQQFRCLGFMLDAMTSQPRRQASTEESVLNWNVAFDKNIKIDADTSAYVTYMKVPGCIPFDVRVLFQQLFPKAEVGKGSSLNFYLKACNLPSKAEMPISEMWQIRTAEDAAQMRHVAHYCVTDAQRCQDLLVKRNVINDRREVGALSYVSVFDTLFYAGGLKVRNLLNAAANRRGLLCSNINNEHVEEGKYPGAWVFYPEKGLVPDPTEATTAALEIARAEYLAQSPPAETSQTAVLRALDDYRPGRPVTGLDFSSLYPSLIMTYNLSPEKFVEDPAEAGRLEAAGVDLYSTEFPFQGRTVRGWFVRHGGVSEDYGLYPSILIDLFNKRAAMKKKLAVQEGLKEHMEVVMGLVQKAGSGSAFLTVFTDELAAQRAKLAERAATITGRDDWRAEKETAAIRRNVEYMAAIAAEPAADRQEAFRAQYCETCFEYASIDSKQRALKLFMNTFYGEAGNKRSAFFLRQLAGGVTAAGQYNIKMVADFVDAKGFKIKYGDTDSLYVSAPERFFKDTDRRYALGELGKEEYWTEMILITMGALDVLRDQVNAHLSADNGTTHLKMAYEEVLFPYAFTAKKKYFGIAHFSTPNFHPKEIFIRGIDVVKQGQTQLAIKIGYRIMWAAVSLGNRRNLQSIVEEMLQEAVENSEQWFFEDFIQTDAWKPNKDNKSVQLFITRMRTRVAEEKIGNTRRLASGLECRKRMYYIPYPGERFRYVLVKPGGVFNLRGLKENQKKGQVMEYAEVAQALNLPIDVGRYLQSYVVGLCARFVNYAEQFLPAPQCRQGMNDKDIDRESQEAAKKYFINFIASLQNADPETVRKRGYAYKRAWKKATLECCECLHAQIGPTAEVLHGENLLWSDFLLTEREETVASIVAQAQAVAEETFGAQSGEYLSEYCRVLGISPNGSDLVSEESAATASRLYCVAAMLTRSRRDRGRARQVTLTREVVLSALDRSEASVRARLASLIPDVAVVATRYEASLAEVVNLRRAEEHDACPDDLGMFGPKAVEAGGGVAAEGGAARTLALDKSELEFLEEVRSLWYQLVGIFYVRRQHQATVDHLEALKARRRPHAARLDSAAVRRTIAASAEHLSPGAGLIGNGGY